MHAIVFEVDMKEGQEEAARAELGPLMEMVKEVPGFVRGTWLADGRRGLSVVVFESEAAARDLADNAAMPPDSAVSFRSADIYEVWGEARR